MTTAPYDTLAGRLQDATRRAEVLRAVIESIGGELALDALLARMVESAVGVLGASYGTISLLTDTADGPALRTAAIHNLEIVGPPRDFRPGEGLGGWILRERRAVRLDRYADLGVTIREDILDHAVLGVPIWWGDAVIGHVAIGAPPPHRFDEEDERTLDLFARHAAIAIRVARQFEAAARRAERSAVLVEIARLVTGSLSLEELLPTAVQALGQHLSHHTIALMLVDPNDPETLVLTARGGVYIESNLGAYRQSIHQGIAGAAARERRTLHINDVRSDPRYITVRAGGGLVAELAIPLVVGDRLLGLLNIESDKPIPEEDAADFGIAAAQLAIAIEHARLYGETRAALDETHLLYETSRRIGLARDTDGVVRAYLEGVAARGLYRCTVSLHATGDDGRAMIEVHGRWTPADGITIEHQLVPRSRDAFDVDLDAGRTVTVADVATDPRLSDDFRRTLRARGVPAVAMIPLMAGGRRIGLVILSASAPGSWTGADLRPYQVTTAQLGEAIESRRQQAQLEERNRRLAVFEERNRLARELHDAITQSVFSVSLIAQSLAPAMRRDPAEAERRVERLVEQSHAAMRELRALIAELRPAARTEPAPEDEIALGAALIELTEALEDHGLDVTLALDGYVSQVQPHERALRRIAQESLSNILKHANARRVTLRLAAGARTVRLTIGDDGDGFDPAAPRPAGRTDSTASGGVGLGSMRERVEMLGGRLRLHSTPGAGTTVQAELPRKDATP